MNLNSINKRMYVCGIINKISHSLGQNLIVQHDYPSAWYYNVCIETLMQAGLPHAYAKLITMMGVDSAYNEMLLYKKGKLKISGHGGSAIHPSVLLWEDAVKLSYYLHADNEDIENDLQYIREVAVAHE